jgi:hypothetical protein
MLNETEIAQLESNLAQCTGTQNYYKHWTGKMVYTDGIKTLQEGGQCGWLIDAIASYQGEDHVKSVPFQLWEVKVNDDKTGVLTMREDSDRPIIVEQNLDYTDFPFKEFKLYLIDDGENHVLILPSEY